MIGRFWADRWHGTELTSPRQVRNALVYVLHNHAKHAGARGVRTELDPLSSAAFFDGFASPRPDTRAGPFVIAGTWLLRAGWKRHGLLRSGERPAH